MVLIPTCLVSEGTERGYLLLKERSTKFMTIGLQIVVEVSTGYVLINFLLLNFMWAEANYRETVHLDCRLGYGRSSNWNRI